MEVVALLPLIALLAVGVAQALAALDAWGAAHEAARMGARAELVGVPARSVVRPSVLGGPVRGAHVRARTTATGAHRVRVDVPVPTLLPWMPPVRAVARAEVAP